MYKGECSRNIILYQVFSQGLQTRGSMKIHQGKERKSYRDTRRSVCLAEGMATAKVTKEEAGHMFKCKQGSRWSEGISRRGSG